MGGEKKENELSKINRVTKRVERAVAELNAIPGVTATYNLEIKKSYPGPEAVRLEKD
jgi:hypothetical protein